MLYSNDLTQIRAGLVNYIGAMLQAVKYEDRAKKQVVSSILIEEAMTLSQDTDGVFDLFVLKPMIRGTVLMLNQRVAELSKLPKNEQVTAQIAEYRNAISIFEKLIAVLN